MITRFTQAPRLVATLGATLIALAGCSDSGGASIETGDVHGQQRPEAAVPQNADPQAEPPTPPGKVVTDPLRLELPDAKTDYEAGEPVWAIQPDAGSGRWKYGRARFDESLGRSGVVVTGEKRHELPAAFVHPALPAVDLRPGQPVLAHADGRARLVRVQAISGDTIRIKYANDDGKTKEAAIGADQIEVLERNSLAPGAPVLFSRGRDPFIGTIALVTGEKAYVICGGLLELDRTAVTPLDLTKIIKADTRALVATGDTSSCHATEAIVVGTLEAGVLYDLNVGEKRIAVPYGRVSIHPSVPRPKAP